MLGIIVPHVATDADILRMVAVVRAPLPVIFIVVIALLEVRFCSNAVKVVHPDLVSAVGDDR